MEKPWHENLKDAIKKSGLSLRDLENKSGIPHSAIQRYAAGKTDRVPLERLKILASCLGTTADVILGWEAPTYSEILSSHERNVISAYRSHPEMQTAVDRLLGIDDRPTVAEDLAAVLPAAMEKKCSIRIQMILPSFALLIYL